MLSRGACWDGNSTRVCKRAWPCEPWTGALADRPISAGIIHHSDQGVQYASAEYVDRLQELGFQISMSRKGAPWETGRAESFIKTLKAEEVSLKQYRDMEQARRSIGHFLEDVYNQRRLHSALGYMAPAQFEANFQHNEAASRQLAPEDQRLNQQSGVMGSS